MKQRPALVAALLLACLACGCAQQAAPGQGAQSTFVPSSAPPSSSLAQGPAPAAAPCYFDVMADAAIAEMGLGSTASDYDKVRAAYRYVIAATTYIEYDQEELVELWRYEDVCGKVPTPYQVAGAGPLLYGIGTCENYASALIVLLQRLGFEALYVTGRTFSVQGTLVDHAWVMVKIEDIWYHIDPQLEDNVSKGPLLFYHYFLKGDEEFRAHHVWGAALPRPDEHSLSLPACPISLAPPAAEELSQAPRPDVEALVTQARRAMRIARARGRTPSTLAPDELPPLPRYVEADPALQANPGGG